MKTLINELRTKTLKLDDPYTIILIRRKLDEIEELINGDLDDQKPLTLSENIKEVCEICKTNKPTCYDVFLKLDLCSDCRK